MDTAVMPLIELFPRLADAARIVVETFGHDVVLGGCLGPAHQVERDGISILLRSPKTLAPGVASNYGVDVWFDGKKVFSVCWNSNTLKDYELVSLKRGPWIGTLLEMARQ